MAVTPSGDVLSPAPRETMANAHGARDVAQESDGNRDEGSNV